MATKGGVTVRVEIGGVVIQVYDNNGNIIEKKIPITDWSSLVTDTLATPLQGPLGKGLVDALLGIAV